MTTNDAWPDRAADMDESDREQALFRMFDLAEDMHAAAVEAGDSAPAGPGRAFAAERAAAATDLRHYVYDHCGGWDARSELDHGVSVARPERDAVPRWEGFDR